MVYVLAYLLLAALLILITMLVCENIRDGIFSSAMMRMEIKQDDVVRVYKATINASVRVESGGTIYHEAVVSGDNASLYALCGYVQMLGFLVWPLCCLWLAARRFYRRKLREPLALLQEAAMRIGQNDLDFSLCYGAKDELGRLCADFEQMRAGVLAHERDLWRTLEERRRQTAALTHDLRTPLTVLKGQTELLEASAQAMTPQKLREAVHTMRGHILRMERYVAGLGEMRRTEEADVRLERISLPELAEGLRRTAGMLCGERGLCLDIRTDFVREDALADVQLIERVFDNLLSNALRYAQERIQVALSYDGRYVRLRVTDDGPGFSAEALERAAEPFFSESKTGADGHLGLGLNIARVLCERCGGRISVQNAEAGGAVVIADFASVEKS